MAQPYEIVAGPLTIWLAPVGTAFPLIDADPAEAWKLMGTSGTRNYSNDGVSVQLSQTIGEARPAGALGPVKAWRTEEDALFGVEDAAGGVPVHAGDGVDAPAVAAPQHVGFLDRVVLGEP